MKTEAIMNKYNEIEIQTARLLYDAGYKWLARCRDGEVAAFSEKPYKHKASGTWSSEGKIVVCVSGEFTPIFQDIKWTDDEPTYIEDIIKSQQILDEAERRYLSAVIRPFRDQVRSVAKYLSLDGRKECILISTCGCGMLFPDFEANTMYKGMEIGKRYTFEELGL